MKTEDKPPLCQLCLENQMVCIGQLNGVKIHKCPKCDVANKK